MSTNLIYSPLLALTQQLLAEGDLITDERKATLGKLTEYISRRYGYPTALNFLCTHNSRRSHLGMVWAAVAAYHFELPEVTTYSGGTEATAMNPRTVAALRRAGFGVADPGGDNPRYEVSFAAGASPLVCFSKRYDAPVNPRNNFAAVMTCSDADERCPVIAGADLRLPLTYEDPKVADDTPQEADRYDERLRQIGRELLWAFARVRAPR